MEPSEPELRPVRALALLGGTGVLAAVSWGLAGAPVGRVAAALTGRRGADAGPPAFADALEAMAGVAALGCSGWLFVAAVLVCWDLLACASTAPDARLLRPEWMRRLLVAGGTAALGATLVASPSGAEPATGPAVAVSGTPLTGLPLPDRATGADAAPPAPTGVRYTVGPGDSLWLIADRLLPPGTSAADVAAACRLLHRTNRDRLGPDLDLIFPGTTLHVPAPLSSGKDRP